MGAAEGRRGVIAGMRLLGHPVARTLLFLALAAAAFQQTRRLAGPAVAIAASALLFGAYHMMGTGYWAMGAVFRFAMPALGGLVFAYALVRTGSLAVPIGLHWGGNWAQAVLFGLGHAPGQSGAVWIMPLDDDRIRALVAPDLLPNLPYLVTLALACVLVRLTPRGLGRPVPRPTT